MSFRPHMPPERSFSAVAGEGWPYKGACDEKHDCQKENCGQFSAHIRQQIIETARENGFSNPTDYLKYVISLSVPPPQS